MSEDHEDSPDAQLLKLAPYEAAVAARLIKKLTKIQGPSAILDEMALFELACRLYGSRRERRHFFSEDLFGEPVWDMLLHLYCSEGRSETTTVSGLCYSSGAPPTTALRWLAELEKTGLVFRRPNPDDKRGMHVGLTDVGREKLSNYLRRVGERYFEMD